MKLIKITYPVVIDNATVLDDGNHQITTTYALPKPPAFEGNNELTDSFLRLETGLYFDPNRLPIYYYQRRERFYEVKALAAQVQDRNPINRFPTSLRFAPESFTNLVNQGKRILAWDYVRIYAFYWSEFQKDTWTVPEQDVIRDALRPYYWENIGSYIYNEVVFWQRRQRSTEDREFWKYMDMDSAQRTYFICLHIHLRVKDEIMFDGDYETNTRIQAASKHVYIPFERFPSNLPLKPERESFHQVLNLIRDAFFGWGVFALDAYSAADGSDSFKIMTHKAVLPDEISYIDLYLQLMHKDVKQKVFYGKSLTKESPKSGKQSEIGVLELFEYIDKNGVSEDNPRFKLQFQFFKDWVEGNEFSLPTAEDLEENPIIHSSASLESFLDEEIEFDRSEEEDTQRRAEERDRRLKALEESLNERQQRMNDLLERMRRDQRAYEQQQKLDEILERTRRNLAEPIHSARPDILAARGLHPSNFLFEREPTDFTRSTEDQQSEDKDDSLDEEQSAALRALQNPEGF